MCLSTVYLDKKDPKNIVMEEAASIASVGGGLLVSTLFGERKSLAGHSIAEVNLLEHYVIVNGNGDRHG